MFASSFLVSLVFSYPLQFYILKILILHIVVIFPILILFSHQFLFICFISRVPLTFRQTFSNLVKRFTHLNNVFKLLFGNIPSPQKLLHSLLTLFIHLFRLFSKLFFLLLWKLLVLLVYLRIRNSHLVDYSIL